MPSKTTNLSSLTRFHFDVSDSLKIGDYIIFSDILGCFLSVEGILLEELVGVDAISSLHDSVFCVHLQRQYSAARELNAFLEKYGMDVKNITEDSELKYLQALEVSLKHIYHRFKIR